MLQSQLKGTAAYSIMTFNRNKTLFKKQKARRHTTNLFSGGHVLIFPRQISQHAFIIALFKSLKVVLSKKNQIQTKTLKKQTLLALS